MRPSRRIRCQHFPCKDVDHAAYVIPGIEVDPQHVSVVLISEAAPADPADYYYARGEPLFQQTTVQAFRDADVEVDRMADILARGVYLTTAVKCAKKSYGLSPDTILACSHLLEKELAFFPNVRAVLLMGDVAIKAVNLIAKRAGEPRVIAAGSTYKIRGQVYTFRGTRAFPSYLQAGPSFFIEKSKRRMIAEDIRQAMRLAARS